MSDHFKEQPKQAQKAWTSQSIPNRLDLTALTSMLSKPEDGLRHLVDQAVQRAFATTPVSRQAMQIFDLCGTSVEGKLTEFPFKELLWLGVSSCLKARPGVPKKGGLISAQAEIGLLVLGPNAPIESVYGSVNAQSVSRLAFLAGVYRRLSADQKKALLDKIPAGTSAHTLGAVWLEIAGVLLARRQRIPFNVKPVLLRITLPTDRKSVV